MTELMFFFPLKTFAKPSVNVFEWDFKISGLYYLFGRDFYFEGYIYGVISLISNKKGMLYVLSELYVPHLDLMTFLFWLWMNAITVMMREGLLRLIYPASLGMEAVIFRSQTMSCFYGLCWQLLITY